LLRFQDTDDFAATSVYITIYVFLTNYVFLNIIVAISCEYFQVVVPSQKSMQKTLTFTA
jgi:hypothetical protein